MIIYVVYALFLAWLVPQVVRVLMQYVRHLSFASKLQGFPTVPILGNAHQLATLQSHEFMAKLISRANEIAASGDNVLRVWILNELNQFPLTGESVKEVVESRSEINKGSVYDFVVPWLGTSVLIGSGDKWASRRKMLTPTFHFAMLDCYVCTFNEHSRKLVRILGEIECEVDAFPFIKRCALDIICDAAMGVTANAQEEKDSEYVTALGDMLKMVQDYSLAPWLWNPIGWRLSGFKRRYDHALDVMLGFTRKVIRDRFDEYAAAKARGQIEVGGEKRRMAFLDLLLEMNEQNKMSEEDLREEVDTFMFAGHDTTSTGISWSLWCLASHPDIQEKCHQELDEIFGDSDRDCSLDDMKRMSYLGRCIKEAMRICAPVPFVSRTLVNDLPMSSKHTAPAGSCVLIAPILIHNNEQIYPNPSVYDPDRFLPENVAKRHAYDYIPFSAGPRNCIGQKFAQYEEKVMVSWVLRRFRIEATQPFLSNQRCPEVVLRPLLGTPLRLIPRK